MATPKIEFFADNENLLEFGPVPARKALPDWFREMSPAVELPPGSTKFPFGLSKALRLSNINATIRRCPGVISYLSEGYLIPLWADFLVQVRGGPEVGALQCGDRGGDGFSDPRTFSCGVFSGRLLLADPVGQRRGG